MHEDELQTPGLVPRGDNVTGGLDGLRLGDRLPDSRCMRYEAASDAQAGEEPMYEATPQVAGRKNHCCTIAGRRPPSSRSPHVAREAKAQGAAGGRVRLAGARHLEV